MKSVDFDAVVQIDDRRTDDNAPLVSMTMVAAGAKGYLK